MAYIFTTIRTLYKKQWFEVFYACFAVITCCTSVKAQTTEPYNWSNVAIGGGGFVSGIITSKEQPGLMYARTDVGGAYRWDAAGSKWIPLMDWASDQEQGMFGVESIAIDPQSPNIVYMAAGISYFNSGRSYILRSIDYGANFTITEVTSQFKMHGNGGGRQNGEKLQVDPNNSAVLYYGSRRNGLFKSTNSGANWSLVGNIPSSVTVTPNDNGFSFLLLDKSSVSAGVTKRIFAGISIAGNNQNFYRSDDGGATFTAVVNSALPATLMPQRAVFSGDGNIFITYANGAGPSGGTNEPMDQGQIWKYNIATGTWANVSPPTTRALSGISVDPANPQRLVASTINTYLLQGTTYGDRFFISANGGTTWTDIVASRGFTMDPNGITWVSASSIHWAGCIEFDPSNTNKVLVTSGNGIFINEDINTSKVWKFNVKGLEETVPLNFISIPGGPAISVIGDYGGFRHTDVTQYAPSLVPGAGSTSGLDYAALNTNRVVRVSGTKMFYSNDMGITGTETATLLGNGGQVALSADGNTILHASGTTTYRTTNNGAAWALTNLGISSARPVADAVNPNKFYAYNPTDGNLYSSIDGGVSFSVIGNAGASNGSKVIRTVPGKEGHIWVPLSNGGLSRSTNSGSSFTKLTNVTVCGAVGIGKAAAGGSYPTIYIYGTVNGVLGIHRSADEGATWVRVNDDAHEYGGPANGQFIAGDMNVYGRVYMSTAGRGIIYGEVIVPVNTAPTDIAISSTDIVQGNAVGDVIGTLSSSDANAGSSFVYSLVGGTGSTDNTAFSIAGAQLKAGIVFNFNIKQTYSIRVRTTDNSGLSFEKAFTINVKKTFSLPGTNFRVLASNETCSTNNDGKISITAVQTLNYKATLTRNGSNLELAFANTLEIPSLAAGVYSLCLTVQGQNGYQQCYDLTITEPQPLSVYTSINLPAKLLVLDMGGSDNYHVLLNGRAFTTSADNITLNMANGSNELIVTTGKDCQGIFKKSFFIEDGKRIYPNPFDNTLTVALGNDPSRSAQVSIRSVSGALIYSKQLIAAGGFVQLDLTDLKSGIYMVNVKTGLGTASSKVIKK